MTFDEAMKQAKFGFRVRHQGMGEGWVVGWFGTNRGEPYAINPVTGSNYLYRASDGDKARTWEMADKRTS